MNAMIFLTTVWTVLAVITVVDAVDLDECFMEDTSDCPLSDLTKSTLIYPGNNTRCFDDTKDDGSDNPYFFQVTPGTSNNLIVYFQGGGSCADDRDCSRGAGVRRSPEPLDREGIFDDRGSNDYADWTAVKILYCSGDLHLGNGDDGDTIFTGRANVRSVLDWTTSNVVDAPERVLIVGTSAGSLGVAVWSNRLLQWLKNAYDPTPTATVVMDCAMPTGDVKASNVPAWGVCGDGALDEFGYASDSGLCGDDDDDGDGTSLSDFQVVAQASHPDVPFVFIASKQDTIMYPKFCASYEGATCWQSDFYRSRKDALEEYHEKRGSDGNNNNVLSYFINAPMHVITKSNKMYLPGKGNIFQTLILPDTWFQARFEDWLDSIVLRGESYYITSQCGPWFSLLPPWPFTDLFCDSKITNQCFKSSG